jgi:hypothetical protein
VTVCPDCGHNPDASAGLILYAGGPGAVLPTDTSSAAVRARKKTPAVRDTPEPAVPVTARSAAPARRQTKSQAAQVAAWRKKARSTE